MTRILPDDATLSRLLRSQSCRSIAAEYGVSVSAVAQHARRLEANRPRDVRKLPPDDVLRLALPCLSMAEAMRGWGVSRAVLRRAAARLGVEWRGRWEPLDGRRARPAVRALEALPGRAAARAVRLIEAAQ